ncbi:hypothetical protein BCR44DRAFT_1515592 [Catenaria anguillulae PL171]|uniref:GAIN-B domain-containing protein n=1 Tax=Catenaria anguillulae PL171 TaxID=765915 RepID=A0A1Y2HCB2_9FUNG|nr:hypothetical protein BCR44DRAFT_1515592 [Catenaria anguillulae PL171]
MVAVFAAWSSWKSSPTPDTTPFTGGYMAPSDLHVQHGLHVRVPQAFEHIEEAFVATTTTTTTLTTVSTTDKSTSSTMTPTSLTSLAQPTATIGTFTRMMPTAEAGIPATRATAINLRIGGTYAYLGSNATIASIFANRFQQRTRQPRMEVPWHWISSSGEPLTFRITAYESYEQFASQYSSVQVVTISRADSIAPVLEQSDRLHVVGLNDIIRAKTNIRFPPCANVNSSQAVLNFSWKLFKSSDGSEVNMTTLPDVQGLTNRNVGFRVSTLDYGSYELRSIVTYNGVSVAASSKVSIVPSDLRVAINGGNYQIMTVSRNNTLSLRRRFGQPQLHDTLKHLTAGTTYAYAVALADQFATGRKIALDMVYIEASSSLLPRVLAARVPARSLVSVEEDVIVFARVVDATTGARVSEVQGYSWTVSPRSVTTLAGSLPGRRGDSVYVIPKNTFAVGSDVTLRATASLPGNSTVSTDVRIQYVGLPTGGTLSVFNDRTGQEGGSGVGFTDTFTLTTAGWTGGVTPYSYSFGFTFSNGQGTGAREFDKFVAFGLSSPSKPNVRFPPSADKAFVVVTDGAGVRARLNTSLTLSRPAGQNVQSLIADAQARAESIRGILSASPDDAISELAGLLDMLDSRNSPANPSASERGQIASLQKQVNAWMVNAATNRGSLDSGFAAQSASMLNNLDLATVYTDAASLSNTVDLIQLAISGAKVGRGGATVRADPDVTSQLATVVDDLLKRQFAASSPGSQLRRRMEGLDAVHTLVRRQASLEAQLRATAASLLSSAIAGDSCDISGVASTVVGPQGAFWGAARRITPTGSELNDVPRAIGNFTVTLPNNLPSGCWDALLIQWRQARGSEVPTNRILSPSVLSVNLYNAGSTTAGPNVTSSIVRFVVSNLSPVPTGQEAKCVGYMSNAWTATGCETSAYTNSTVTCDCNMAATEFAVQAQPSTNPSPTPTPGPTGGDNTGAITGGVIGGVAGVCVLGGGLALYRRHRAGYSST